MAARMYRTPESLGIISCDFLSSLISPNEVEEFVQIIWSRKTKHFRGALGDATGEILSLESFELMLATLNRGHEGWLHFARGGLKRLPQDATDADGMLDMRKIRAAFIAGETLYLTKAERLSKPLMRLCRAIESDLAAQGVDLRRAPNAHVFLTPPQAQGFPVHIDEHGSFVLQIEGEKQWTVYEPADLSYFNEIPCSGSVDPNSLGNFTEHSFHLKQGDVLYMPEWWPHEAQTSSAHSLHVTLRVFPLRWVDILHDICAVHPALHQSVPNGTASSPAAADAISNLLQSAAFRMPLSRLLDETQRQRTISRPALPDDGLRQAIYANQLDLDTELQRPDNQACIVFGKENEVCIGFSGGLIRGPSLIRNVFEYVSGATVFRPRDLPPIEGEDYDRLEVARTLIREGLLRIVRNY